MCLYNNWIKYIYYGYALIYYSTKLVLLFLKVVQQDYKKGSKMNVAIILAAGQGKRFGAEVPKQFVEVLGKPILAYTLEVFRLNAKSWGLAGF